MARCKIGGRTYIRAMFLKDRALELVKRHGVIEQMPQYGFARRVQGQGFSIFFVDPEDVEVTDFFHLDVHADGMGKVLNVTWLPNCVPEVVSFKRGAWENLFTS